MKVEINCSTEELFLIERALELYARIGMCQFENLDMCYSLQKQIWDHDVSQEFDEKCRELKSLFGFMPFEYPGIFNTNFVGDDCRIAMHMYQQLRHERFKYRVKTGEQTEKHYTLDESPADICSISGIKHPDFEIKID